MDLRTPAVEASLLFRHLPELNSATLSKAICDILDEYDVASVHAEQVEDGFTVFSGNEIQVLVAFTKTPLPVEHFLDAHRPAAANLSEPEMLSRLTGHEASATVLVLDHSAQSARPARDQDSLQQALAWEISVCLCQYAEPDLVFWCATDTLYAHEEFDRATHYFSQCAPAPQVKSAAPFADLPEITEASLAWIDDQIEDAREVYDLSGDFSEQVATEVLPPSAHAPDQRHGHNHTVARRAFSGLAIASSLAAIGMISVPNLAPLFL